MSAESSGARSLVKDTACSWDRECIFQAKKRMSHKLVRVRERQLHCQPRQRRDFVIQVIIQTESLGLPGIRPFRGRVPHHASPMSVSDNLSTLVTSGFCYICRLHTMAPMNVTAPHVDIDTFNDVSGNQFNNYYGQAGANYSHFHCVNLNIYC
jgi:hypothetical protein